MKRLICFILIGVTLLMAGCGALLPKENRLLLAARYGELQSHLEGKIGSIERASNIDIWLLCEAYANLKNYDKLSAGLAEIKRRINRGDTDVIILGSKNNDLTWVYGALQSRALIETGKYTQAIILSQKTIEFIKGEDRRKYRSDVTKRSNYINILEALGLACALNNQREEAKAIIRELQIIQTSDVYILLTESKYTAIARINMALGRYANARSALEELENHSDFKKKKAEVDFVVAAVLQLGDMWSYRELPEKYSYYKVLLETGKVVRAKQGYDELLKVPQVKDNGTIYWMILFDRGRIAEQEGNLKQAISFYIQSIDIIEQQRSTINTEASKIGFVGDKQDVYRHLINALFNNKQYASAFDYIERSKSRALVDMLAMKKDFSIQAGNEKEVRELLAVQDRKEQEAIVQDELVKSNHTRSIIIKTNEQLQQQVPELASLVSVTSLSVAAIQKLIPRDETLVEYYYTDKYLFIFVMTSRGLSAFRLNSGHLADDIKNFRRSIENASSNTHAPLAGQLFTLLIKPIEEFLPSRRLVIVPHGALHYLPFYALYDGNDFMIERYHIRMLPSASMLQYLQREQSKKPGGILAFGNPYLGNPKYDLVNAEIEAVSVSKTLPRSKVFLRKDATETALKRYGEGFHYIHFATHGEFNADKPLNSALLLAADAKSNGRLTVDKLYSMKLDADLVTLSACETGLGKITNGDDVVGLTRGFLYAGSSSIVASLWKVDDLATSRLMTSFYEALKHKDKCDALRMAQLQSKGKYPHPYYWASFQLTGNAK